MDAAPAAWEDLARGLGLEPRAPALLGLSGGADSVFLLHLLAESSQRPEPLLAVHIHHGLRGRESDADEQFCRDLCRQLGVELEVLRLELDPRTSGLEQRARDARRAGFARLAAARGIRTVLLAHQREDADETQFMRWLRGSDWAALGALRARRSWRVSPTLSLELVRPLLSMSRAQLRADLERRGLSWREDASNLDLRMARNRVRHRLVPLLGADWIRAARQLRETTSALDKNIESLRPRLELLPVAHALARHPASFRLDLETLRNTHPVLASHALGEALARGTRRRPRPARLEALLELGLGTQSFQRRLPGRWRAVGRRGRLELIPPAPTLAAENWNPSQALLLADGRRLSCEWRCAQPSEPIAPGPDCVELACEAPPAQLSVRFDPRGLRFWPLGAPRPTRLVRFLQGAGIPSAARTQVPLVFLGAELAWVAGVRIAEPLRIREGTRGRLRLRLESGRG